MDTLNVLRQILARLVRIETRLVRTMDHLGLDPEGATQKPDQLVTEQKGSHHEQRT